MEAFGGHIDFDAQFFAETQFLNVEIRFDDVQFLFERQERFARFQKVAQDVREVQDGIPRALRIARLGGVTTGGPRCSETPRRSRRPCS